MVISWVIFKCEDLSYCLSYLKAMFGGFSAGLFNTESLYLLKSYGILLVILILGSTRLPKFLEKMEKRFGENGGVMTGARMIFTSEFCFCPWPTLWMPPTIPSCISVSDRRIL
ncbi:MAG: hypothetical protein ACLR2E_16560 [Lachnospiraceae bacterium]